MIVVNRPMLGGSQRDRGRTIDDVLPEVVERYLRAPHVTSNDYIGHRCMRPAGDLLACDCGETFGTATELGAHQQGYRHPGASTRPR